MQKRMLKRILAGFCTVAMLSQTILETGIAAYAADGTESRIVSEEATEDEEAVSGEEAVSEDAVTDAASEEAVKDAANDEEEAAEEAEATEDEEEEDEASEADGQAGTVIVDPGTGEVKVKDTVYGTLKDGVFTVSKSLTAVPSFLFYNWNELKEIRFEEGSLAKTIGVNTNVNDGAFANCLNLTKVDMTNATNLTSIMLGAFKGCKSLKYVTFNDGLQFIEKNAFQGCEGIETITFNKKLLRIEEQAFMGCKSLSEIILTSPNTECVTSSKAAATKIFNGCAIEKFTLSTEDGAAIFPSNLFNLATFKEGITIDIDDNVLEISEGAFKGSNIENVNLPKRLNKIGKSAFEGCGSLKAIDFSVCDLNDGLTLEDNAFASCISLTDLNLRYAGEGKEHIHFNKIGNRAFAGCEKLATLVLPDRVATRINTDATSGERKFDDSLGSSVFENCKALTSVTFPDGPVYVGDAMFKGCVGLYDLSFKEDDDKVSSIEIIGKEAFKGCTSLYTVDLPENLLELRNAAFAECALLKEAELSVLLSLEFIGDDAFLHNNNYSTTFPDSLLHIGKDAFNSCIGAKFFGQRLIIPPNVNYIGAGAFQYTRVNYVEIRPMDIAFCGEKIFYQDYIEGFVLPIGVSKIPGNLFNQTTWVTGKDVVIPNTVKVIGKGAFSGASGGSVGNIESVTFEEGIQLDEIGEAAFRYNTTLKSIDLPNSLKTIGNYAFADCTNLKEITIPEGVTTIGTQAFYKCSLLEKVYYNAIAVTSNKQNIFQYCNLKSIEIGGKVQLFPDYLFKGAQFQKQSEDSTDFVPVTLDIPASVTRIGEYCLTNVVNLAGINFAAGSNLKTIAKYAFSGCTMLQDVKLPANMESIEDYAFQGCTQIAGKLDLPAGLVKLGKGAFTRCECITETVIPAGLTEVADELFLGCKGLVVVGFASGSKVTKIGNNAFKDCTMLAGIMLPVGLKSLGSSSFLNCTALERIVIPEGTTMIGANCFAGCTGLTEVSIPASVTNIGANAFKPSECAATTFIVVPDSYADKWLRNNGFTVSTLKKITYELNGGQNDPENPNGYQVGDTTVLKPATRLGCEFGGWYLEPEFRTEITSVEGMTDDFTVYAKWNLIKYTITYVLNEGTNSDGNPENYTVEDTVRFKKAVKTGFSWGGWFTEPEFTNEIKEIKPGTKAENLTLYAKWNEGASSESAFNNTPSINPDAEVQDLWLVQGQKFTMETGWTLANPKADKKYVSLSNKGAFKAKKVTVAPVVLVKGERKINVTITKPEIEKKITIVHDEENNESRKVQFTYDVDHLNVYWYSAAPDVAVVDQDGTVTAVGKGKAKITAYIYGCAYNCTVTVNELKTENRTLHVNVGGSKSVKLTKANKPVWTIEDPLTAKNKKSKVTGVAPGHTNLNAVMKDGSIYTVAVTVEDITLKTGSPAGKNKYNLNLKAGESVALAFVSVEQEFVFKSSKPDVAYVDEDGWVVAKAAGKTKLTTKINGKTVTVNVVVTP